MKNTLFRLEIYDLRYDSWEIMGYYTDQEKAKEFAEGFIAEHPEALYSLFSMTVNQPCATR